MIHFIRDKNNDDIVDLETTQDDIHSVVCIVAYSHYLLSLPIEKQPYFISDMFRIQELRGEYYERVHPSMKPREFAKQVLPMIAKKWDLFYIED